MCTLSKEGFEKVTFAISTNLLQAKPSQTSKLHIQKNIEDFRTLSPEGKGHCWIP